MEDITLRQRPTVTLNVVKTKDTRRFFLSHSICDLLLHALIVFLMLAKVYSELNQLCLMWPSSCSAALWPTRSSSIFFIDSFKWPETCEGVNPKPFSFMDGLHRCLLQHANWQIRHAKSTFTMFMPIISTWPESHFSRVRHSDLRS